MSALNVPIYLLSLVIFEERQGRHVNAWRKWLRSTADSAIVSVHGESLAIIGHHLESCLEMWWLVYGSSYSDEE